MRNMFAMVGFCVVLFLGLGWYLGWYKVDWSTNNSGKQNINFEVDSDKLGKDFQKGVTKATQFVKELKKPELDENSPDFVGPPAPTNATSPTKSPSTLPGPFRSN